MPQHSNGISRDGATSRTRSRARPSRALGPPAEPPKSSRISPANLEGARGPFTNAVVDYTAPCTATERRACQIVRHIAVWNELLLCAGLELRDSPSPRGHGLSLVSCEKPSWPSETEDELHMSATLVNVLLKTHRCVTCLLVRTGPLKAYEVLLRDAIHSNSFIKSLTLDLESFDPNRSFSAVLPSLVQLEELQCGSRKECPEEFLDAISTLMRTTKSLTALRISELCINRRGWGPLFMERPSPSCEMEHVESREDLVVIDHDMKNYAVERFMRALMGNSSLKELSLNESIVSEASHEAFEGYLTNSAGLTTLTVDAGADLNRMSADRVLKALLKNTTISKVALIGFCMTKRTTLLVQRILAQNRALRSFEISVRYYYTYGRFTNPAPRTEFDSWLVALTQNDSLEEVTLKFHTALVFSEPDKWEAFAKELPARKNLKKVTIEASREEHFLSVVCGILRLNGADEKVSFRPYNVQDDLDLLECRGFSAVYACLFDNRNPSFRRLADALPRCPHVTTMHLDIWMSRLDGPLSSFIAECIESATSIRELRLVSSLRDRLTTRYWAAIIASLSRSTSVRELRVQARLVGHEHANVLARAVKNSRRIRKVQLNVGGVAETAALVRYLADCVEDCYNLASVSVDGKMNAEAIEDWFAVREVARRNSSLVTRALRFMAADHCWDGLGAAALEQVSRHPELLAAIADELAISEADAAAKVRRELREFEDLHSFMRLAGVVCSQVECHGNDDAGTQLDDLNEHCWLRVRQYLTLDDIGDHEERPTCK